jgi:tetratricopeptide (TPR) repeat protein
MPISPDALAIALAHHQAGRLHEAEPLYMEILTADPNCAPAWHLLGLIRHQFGKQDAAIQHIERALQLMPNYPEAHNNLGLILREQGRLDEAIVCFRSAVELNPGHAEAYDHLGVALHMLGRIDEAVDCYQRGLELNPNDAQIYNHFGNAYVDQGKLDEAVDHYQRAIELDPSYAQAHTNLGIVWTQLERFDDAVSCHQRALAIQPNLAGAYNNLGAALQKQGKLSVAAACYHHALALRPDAAETLVNLGNIHQMAGRFLDASACFQRALELKPDYAWAHVCQSNLSLLAGDFERGWIEYEWRWKTAKLAADIIGRPRWTGQSPTGGTLLLRAEQGMGDTIQFIRYASMVRGLGATVIVECQRLLQDLLASCPGIDAIVAQGEELPQFDSYAPLLSLPGIFKTTLTTVPADIPYVFANSRLVEQWRERLKGINGFRVGIHWQGRGGRGSFRERDIPLHCFAALAAVPGVRLISLQRGDGRNELRAAATRFPIVDPGEDVDMTHGAFMDTAAIMKNVDLVITSDTSIPHLAGALGVHVWLALPFVPSWHWLLHRTDSPWYPTMRLFRQNSLGDWAGVFQKIEAALRKQV